MGPTKPAVANDFREEEDLPARQAKLDVATGPAVWWAGR